MKFGLGVILTLKKVGPFLVAFAAADLRTESLDPDVPPLVSSYCHAALTSLEDAIAHLEPWRPLFPCFDWKPSWGPKDFIYILE